MDGSLGLALITSPNPHSTVNGIEEPLLFGGLLSALLVGANCSQACLYYSRLRKGEDKTLTKITVGFLLLLNTLSFCLSAAMLHFYSATRSLDISTVLAHSWVVSTEMLLTIIVNFCVRCFFLRRLYYVSKCSWTATLPLVVLNVIGCGFALVLVALSYSPDMFLQLSNTGTLSWLTGVELSLSGASDALATMALCVALRKSRTGVPRTDSVLRVLMRYVINTGSATALGYIVCLIVYYAVDSAFVFLTILFLTSKLYLLALLAMLNSRDTLREMIQQEDPSSDLSWAVNVRSRMTQTSGLAAQKMKTDNTELRDEWRRPQPAFVQEVHLPEDADSVTTAEVSSRAGEHMV